MTDTMTGWRLSWLGPDGWLYPPFQDVDTAIPRRAAARCVQHPGHRPPVPDCLCGFYICDTIAALAPLADGLRTMNAEAAVGGLTVVLHTVTLSDPLRSDHLANTAMGRVGWQMLRMRDALFGTSTLTGAVVEGLGTWRGSTLTVTGPIHVPTVPGITPTATDQATARYRCPTVTHDGDIFDVVEALAEREAAHAGTTEELTT